MAARSAAVAPSAADTLSAFEGAFQTHFLPKTAGHPAMRGVELVVGNSAGERAVLCTSLPQSDWL